jgi:hypothetical protein
MTDREIIFAALELGGVKDQVRTLLTGELTKELPRDMGGDPYDDEALRNGCNPTVVAWVGSLLGGVPEVAEAVLAFHERIYSIDTTLDGTYALAKCRTTLDP